VTARSRHRAAGFTLTELMVVVSIIGILATMAIVYMRPHSRPVDVAGRFGDFVHEANRRAIALGPVRADVATALGSKNRTRIVVSAVTATNLGFTAAFTMSRLVEAAPAANPPATWVPIATYTTDLFTLPDTWAPGVGSKAQLLAAGTLSNDWGAFQLACRPDGTCDPRTLFFQAATNVPTRDQFARVSVLPIGGAITTRTDWN
jgi:prepilin-type N-terminal cleavage/methylation domain-containing protein